MYNKIIVMPLWKRANYTKTVLEGLLNCNGIDEYKILIHLEPGYPEVLDVIYSMKEKLNIGLFMNSSILGATHNTYNCMENGFDFSDYVIYFEDDDVPCKDCLKYFEWSRDTYENDYDILSVTSYNRTWPEPDEYYKVYRKQWFTPWGWATWKDRWDEIKTKWNNNIGWDTIINHHVRGDRYEIKPRLARTQNIGAENSVNVPNAQWHKEHHYNEFWVGSVNLPEGNYVEYVREKDKK